MIADIPTVMADNVFRAGWAGRRLGAFSGAASIVGNTASDPVSGVWKNDAPTQANVLLFGGAGLVPVDGVYTADGNFTFRQLNPHIRYTVVAKDILDQYNAVAADRWLAL